ncbi:MAG: hypothetical protein OCD01_04885 [Fibrobacterales bacterium]
MKNILLTISILLFACSSDGDDVSGITDIETGGQIAGTMYTADGSPEAGVTVSLISNGYSPLIDSLSILRKSVVTNAAGEYTFDNLDSGLYAIEVINDVASTGFYNPSLVVTPTSNVQSSDTLQNTGTVVITLPKNALTATGTVYIKNSTRVGIVSYSEDSIPTVLIDKLPAGVYPEFYVSEGGSTLGDLLNVDTIEVIQNDTNFVTPIENDVPLSSALSSSLNFSLSSSSSETIVLSSAVPSSSSVTLQGFSSASISSSSYIPLDSTPVNSVLNFNGEPEHVKIESDMNYDWPTYGITFETWVIWDEMDTIIHLFHLSNGPDNDYTTVFGARAASGAYNLRYAMTNTGPNDPDNPWMVEEVDGAIVLGEWMHVALTITPSGLISFYYNGDLIDTAERGIYANPDAVTRSVNYLGNSAEDRDGVFDGRMDNARIWNRARTAAEIKDNMYHTTQQLSDTTRLVLSYDFVYNPLRSNIVTDGSGNGNDGTLLDMAGTFGADGTWMPQVDFEQEIGQ